MPRPGANLTVPVTSSNPSVLSVNPLAITFSAPDPSTPPQFNISVQPLAVGTAIVSLGPLPGGVTPASGGQLVFNVAEPLLSIPSFTLGRDLAAPTQVKLGSAVPTPSSNLTVSVYCNYPVYCTGALPQTPAFPLNATILAGQRVSERFYVQAMQPGTATLTYSGGGYNSQSSGTVTQTAFVFKEAGQTLSVNNGSTASFTVVPALSPPATPELTPLAIRGGAPPIIVTVKSSNPNVLSVTTPQVTLSPGDQQVLVNVKGLSVGQATLTLSGSIYDFSLAQSSITVSVR